MQLPLGKRLLSPLQLFDQPLALTGFKAALSERLQALLQAITMASFHLPQPVVIGTGYHQHITASMVALAHLIPVHQRPAQHHISKLWVSQGAVDCFAETAAKRAEF